MEREVASHSAGGSKRAPLAAALCAPGEVVEAGPPLEVRALVPASHKGRAGGTQPRRAVPWLQRPASRVWKLACNICRLFWGGFVLMAEKNVKEYLYKID